MEIRMMIFYVTTQTMERQFSMNLLVICNIFLKLYDIHGTVYFDKIKASQIRTDQRISGVGMTLPFPPCSWLGAHLP